MARLMKKQIFFFLVFTISSSYLAHTQVKSESVVAAWLFDKGQGNKAIDATKNGHNGKIEGGAKWVRSIPCDPTMPTTTARLGLDLGTC